jgi:hypothetical protein
VYLDVTHPTYPGRYWFADSIIEILPDEPADERSKAAADLVVEKCQKTTERP